MTNAREPRGQNFFALERIDANASTKYRTTLEDFGAWIGGPVDEEAEHTDRFAPPPRRGIGPGQDRPQQRFVAIANYAPVARASA